MFGPNPDPYSDLDPDPVLDIVEGLRQHINSNNQVTETETETETEVGTRQRQREWG
jgi:hypothetical protein